MDRTLIEVVLHRHGIGDYRWMDPRSVVVAQWVRLKCVFGCPTYGRSCACPPNTPSVAECERFFREYEHGLVLRFAKSVALPEDRAPWSTEVNTLLLALEREVFLTGHRKAMVLFMDDCHACATCPGKREECSLPARPRPSPEGMAVDVFATVRAVGYPIEVLSSHDETMNRYAFLLVE